MAFMKTRATLTSIIAASSAIALVLVAPVSASAAGVGDVSAAVLYEATSPVGAVLTDISGNDDDNTNVALPFPIAFDGIVATALCVSTNGYVVPIATIAGTCTSTYDVSLEEGALEEAQSFIGVLLHDIDLGNPLWKAAPSSVTSVGVLAGVMTITTSGPHGFNIGDNVDVHTSNGPIHDLVASVPDPTSFTFSVSEPDFGPVAETGSAALAFDDIVDDTDSDGLADDGFGAIQQVYAGSTTFDGKLAFAITWYRVMSYEDVNDGRASQTFQIVLVKEATPDATYGNSFSIQFNFGTVTDDESNDGYDVDTPNAECDETRPEDCRFAVGIGYYDSATDTATTQELFGNIAKSDLIDGGAQALVDNSLNSSVDGRYILFVSAPAVLAATGADVPIGALGGGLALLLLGGALIVARGRSLVLGR